MCIHTIRVSRGWKNRFYQSDLDSGSTIVIPANASRVRLVVSNNSAGNAVLYSGGVSNNRVMLVQLLNQIPFVLTVEDFGQSILGEITVVVTNDTGQFFITETYYEDTSEWPIKP